MAGLMKPLVAGGLLLMASALTATAQTTSTTIKQTTTTSTTTTTTTLQPHKFSAATAACVRQARQQFGSCRTTPATCSADFQTAFAKCFAGSAGTSCASKCESREATCLSSAPATKQTCRKNCNKSRSADVRAWNEAAQKVLPGGWAKMKGQIKDGYTLFRFKFVKPGERSGMVYDGLILVNGHWRIFPKAWRALE